MKTTLKILLLSGLIGLTALGCGQNNTVSPNPLPSDSLSAKEAFPNRIGDSWTYSVFDSIKKTTQTVVMKIVGDSLFKNGKTYKIWQYDLSGKKAYYVNITADTVQIISPLIYKAYVFPLFFNKAWTGPAPGKCKITKIETLNVPAGTFKNCYVIHREVAVTNYFLDEYVWFKPHVGVIKRQAYERDLGAQTNRVWKLMSYHLGN